LQYGGRASFEFFKFKNFLNPPFYNMAAIFNYNLALKIKK